jgi:hypothetical protein
MLEQTIFQVVVVLFGALSTTAAAILYFRHVRLERPAIGCFNARDVVILFGFIVTIPVLYLLVPPIMLTVFLVITFVSALSIGYRPVLPRTVLWLTIGLLIATNILVARNLLGTTRGWQLYWVLTSVAVLFAAVAVANLYIQGGMRLRHVAWLALGLAVYDPIFSFGVPLTARLADTFAGFPLDPSIGFRAGLNSANIGIGDLLVYSSCAGRDHRGRPRQHRRRRPGADVLRTRRVRRLPDAAPDRARAFDARLACRCRLRDADAAPSGPAGSGSHGRSARIAS